MQRKGLLPRTKNDRGGNNQVVGGRAEGMQKVNDSVSYDEYGCLVCNHEEHKGKVICDHIQDYIAHEYKTWIRRSPKQRV